MKDSLTNYKGPKGQGKTPSTPPVYSRLSKGETTLIIMNCLPRPEMLTSSFPHLLMDILQNKEISDIASWLPNGRAFAIHNRTRFASEVLPVYFREAKYSSYARRMKRWGFTLKNPSKESCDDASRSKSVYHHPLFLRDTKALCLQMRPKPQKKYLRKKNHVTKGIPAKVSGANLPNPQKKFLRKQNHATRGTSQTVSDYFARPVGSIASPSSLLGMETGARSTFFPSDEDIGQEARIQQEVLILQGCHQQDVIAHHQNLQDCLQYKQLYNNHLMELHAQHQARLEIEAYYSALAYKNTMF